jgi:2-oxoisovalerate dehydrogenase E1 component
MYCDFMGRAGDEIFNQASKWQSMSAGILKMKVVFPATPYDAKGLMNTALNGTDPVVFFESQKLYDTGEMFHEGGVPEEYYEIPIGEPDIKRLSAPRSTPPWKRQSSLKKHTESRRK